MFANLALATIMVGLTVAIHLGGLLGLLWVLRNRGHRIRARESRLVPLGVILFVVLGLVAIHSVEIWLYAAAFWAIVSAAVCLDLGTDMAHWLFWQRKTTGTCQTPAKFSASWKSPSEVAPSPQ